LLLGFAGAFRRSELVALDVADLEETEDGFRVTIRKSKTDQEGLGQTIGIMRGSAACPVRAVTAWLAASGITEGPLFRPVTGEVSADRLAPRAAEVTITIEPPPVATLAMPASKPAQLDAGIADL
jgi:hypothetical protein